MKGNLGLVRLRVLAPGRGLLKCLRRLPKRSTQAYALGGRECRQSLEIELARLR